MTEHSVPDICQTWKQQIQLIFDTFQPNLLGFVKIFGRAQFPVDLSFLIIQESDPIHEHAVSCGKSQQK